MESESALSGSFPKIFRLFEKIRRTQLIRVGIIGCGKIADEHAGHIRFIKDSKLIAVCDIDDIMAKQLYERFCAEKYYTNINDFLESSNLDVVHITTPPQSHYELAKICLNYGCNIYVEKPFSVNSNEASELIDLATTKNLKLTVGHNAQYSHASIAMRKLVEKGYLGGRPNHMESYFGYNLGEPGYAKALLSDKSHWVRNLPGKLMHNIISHGISKIVEYFPSDNPTVIAHGFAGPMLMEIGESDIIDELRVIISDKKSTTAYFTFSTQMRPFLQQFRIYGNKNGLIIDENHQTVIKIKDKQYKSYLNQFLPPLDFSKEYFNNSCSSIAKFLKRNFHPNIGMKFLIESFYKSIQNEGPLPFSYGEILLTTKIMDQIFEQVFPKITT